MALRFSFKKFLIRNYPTLNLDNKFNRIYLYTVSVEY